MGNIDPNIVANIAQGVIWPTLWSLCDFIRKRRDAARLERRETPQLSVEKLRDDTERNKQIDSHLAAMIYHLGAIRGYLGRISNGEKFIDGSCVLKKNRTHEIVLPGITYTQELFRNIAVSTQPEEMDLLLEAGPSFTPIENLRPCRFRYMMDQTFTVATARVGLFQNGIPLGFVGADFSTDVEPANINDMVNFAERIQAIMQS